MYDVCGEKHPMWNGGKILVTEEMVCNREEVKARDNYVCQDCGIGENESNDLVGLCKFIILSHTKNVKHEIDNLITLCSSCHAKADGNLIGCKQWKQRQSLKSKNPA